MSIQEENTHFGKQLKSTRERMGLSTQEAAARLNLRPRFIHALEEEDLKQSTLPLTYLRGYLRSYARLLNIPETQIAKVLEQLKPSPEVVSPAPAPAPAPAPTSSQSLALSAPLSNNPYMVKAATFLVSLVLLASVTTWWYLHTSTSTATVIALNQPSILNSSQSELTANASSIDGVNAFTKTNNQTSPILPASKQLGLAPTLSKPASPSLVHEVTPQKESDDDESPYEQE